MKKQFCILAIFLSYFACNLWEGQGKDTMKTSASVINEQVIDFVNVDQKPEFPNGMTAFYRYVVDNLKCPNSEKVNGNRSRIYVQFVINIDGTIKDAKVVKSMGIGCDEEVIKVLKNMPKWKPGKENGIPIAVRYVVPVTLDYTDQSKKN